jgi:hypothetical protein
VFCELDCELLILVEAEEFLAVFSASVRILAQLQTNKRANMAKNCIFFIKK